MDESQLTFGFQAPDLSYNQLNLAGYQGQLWGQDWEELVLKKKITWLKMDASVVPRL